MAPPVYVGQPVTPFVGSDPVGPLTPFPVVITTPALAFAVVPVATLAAGDNVVVAAVAGKKIRVIGFTLDGAQDVFDATFYSNAAGTQISATRTQSTKWDQQNPFGLFETVAGEDLVLNLSVALALGTLNVAYLLAD